MMNYEVHFDEEKHILRAKIWGPLAAEVTGAAALAGIEIAHAHNCQKYFVDMTETNVKDSTIATFSFMAELDKIGFTRRDKIAIVYTTDGEKHRFAENVAHNRGWCNVRYFSEASKAEVWLTV